MAEAQSSFDLAFNYTVGNEGRYSDQKSDLGGATMHGITHETLSRWLGRPASIAEVRTLTLDTAKSIYERYYWMPLGLDKIRHTGVAMALFDIGVVRGIGVPPKYAQEICLEFGNKIAQDGHIGPITLDAINSISTLEFVTNFKDKVDAGFKAIVVKNPSQEKFLKGWLARSARLLSLAVEPDLLPILAVPPEIPQSPVEPTAPVISEQANLSFGERLKQAFAILFRA